MLCIEKSFERDSAVTHGEGHGFVKDKQPCAVFTFHINLPPEAEFVLATSNIPLSLCISLIICNCASLWPFCQSREVDVNDHEILPVIIELRIKVFQQTSGNVCHAIENLLSIHGEDCHRQRPLFRHDYFVPHGGSDSSHEFRLPQFLKS